MELKVDLKGKSLELHVTSHDTRHPPSSGTQEHLEGSGKQLTGIQKLWVGPYHHTPAMETCPGVPRCRGTWDFTVH